MHWLIDLPAFIKIGGVFLSILVVYRLGVTLGLSILVHALLLSVISGNHGFSGILFICKSMLEPKNYLLLIVMLMLLFFTESLSMTGKMESTVNALKKWMHSRRLLYSGLPALIGLLPMPGGALFSAPMVESVDSEKDLHPAHKAAINYWFRHIWEYWWPLYPGVILAIRYSTLPIGIFFLIQVPFTIASILGGYFFILRKIKKVEIIEASKGLLDLRSTSHTLGPILLLVVLSVAGAALLPKAGVPDSLANLISMLTGISLALVLVYRGKISTFKKSLRMFKRPTTWTLLLVIAGVLSFSSVLQMPLDNGATLVSLMRDEFIKLGIPIIVVMMLIPFISGAVTGIAVGFVGASFPLVFTLLGNHPDMNVLMATTSLAYAFGYLGMILSPVHICFVVTNNFFKAHIFQSYRYILGPSGVVLIAALTLCSGYYFLIR